MNHPLPTRFRHPLDDPDRALARQYRVLFGRDLPAPSRAQVQTLARALMRGDPLADAWVAESLPVGEQKALLARVLTQGVDRVPEAPATLRALGEQLEAVPLWVDAEQLALGGRTFRRTGLLGFFVLADFGLMGGYRSAAVAKTLSMTGRLRYGAAERLIETGRFVTCVTEPGALALGAPGYVAAGKVRVVHALVRAALSSSPTWRMRDWGLPINQADMLGTNLLFSIGLVAGARKLGLRFSADEVHALLHVWRYVGHLLGVEDSLLPADEDSATRALFMVGVSQPPPDADSVALARALHEVPLTFARDELSRRIIELEMGLRVSFTRRMLGDEAADDLGLPKSRMRHVVPPIVSLIGGAERLRERVPLANRVAYRLADYIVKSGQSTLDEDLRAAKSAGE